ncbi:hypothetical protein ACFLZ6_01725 [Nanoarchaeota archaeon]
MIKKGGSKLDFIAGIPSFNNQNSISYVVEQIGKTIENKFKGKKGIIINCDGGSTDKTEKNFLNSKTNVVKQVLRTPPDITGKGNVFKLLFQFAKNHDAKALIVNDSDLRSINPNWVKLQIDSISKKGFDYSTPLYSRYKYDGTITNHICYPLVYGLFCRNIRQPIGGDFAFSSRLSNHWLKCKWPVNAHLFGIDIFMTTNTILGGYKICQVNLGAKIHDAKDPSKSLSPMFRQVISTLFKIIITNKDKINQLKKVEEVPILGGDKLKKPQQFAVNNEAIKNRFIEGYREHKDIIKKALPKEDFHKIRACALHNNVCINDAWWAKIVYDYILAYKKHESKSSTILNSFVPIWFGRVHTFINDTIDMTTEEAETVILKQAEEFYRQRDYLLDKL